jgi:hypothetical protein
LLEAFTGRPKPYASGLRSGGFEDQTRMARR